MASTHPCWRERTCKSCKNFRLPWNNSKKRIISRKHSRRRSISKSESRWITYALTCSHTTSIRQVWRSRIHTVIHPWSSETSSSIYLSSKSRLSWAADLEKASKVKRVSWTAVMKNLSCQWNKFRAIWETYISKKNRKSKTFNNTRATKEAQPPLTHLRESKTMEHFCLRMERRRVTRLWGWTH